jgi:uncharacterized membrane protein
MNLTTAVKTFFKKYMLAGTAVLVPLIGTYMILKFIIVSIDGMMISLLPLRFQPQVILGYDIPGLGLIVTVLVILMAGVVTRLYVGKLLVSIGDRIISKIPLGRSIYSGIKKFLSSILTPNEDRFRSVVAVEYPRKDSWVLGFLTSDCMGEMQKLSHHNMVNVFIPTTPNPTSGFLIMLPQNDVTYLDMKIDEAFKLLISGGILKDDTIIPKQNPPVSGDSIE